VSQPVHTPEEQAEFVHLLTGHQDSLRAFITSRMPGSPDVGDVLQETNAEIWKKRERFEIGTNFTAWSFTIARFAVLKHRRKLRRDELFIYNDELLDRLAPPPEELVPDRLLERQAALESCLAKLPPKQRELIDQRYEKGRSMEEFAEIVGSTGNSLRVTLFRARAALRKCIERRLTTLAPHR